MNLDERVEAWLAALVAEPGLTAIREPAAARRQHLDDALEAVAQLRDGPLVDVGSGGGSPGIPLAAARPDLRVVLLEANQRKAAFLREQAVAFPNVEVIGARAEDHARGPGRDAYGTAVARALAPPGVAVEWCLPLVRPGGRLILYLSLIDGLAATLDPVARLVGGVLVELVPVPGTDQRGLAVLEKLEATPERFPRRPGVARKRPLA